MIVVGLVVALIAPTFIPQPNSRPPKATSVASAEPPAAEGWREPVCILNSVDGYALAVFGHIRTKFSQSNMVISHLSLVDQGKPTSGMIPGDLAEEDGWYWPNYRIACGDKKFTVTKVEPIVLPGRREIVWLDYKQREI